MHHRIVKKYLDQFAKAGLVEEIKIGRMRIYRPIWTEQKIRILKELFDMDEL